MEKSNYLCATDCFLQNEYNEVLLIHRGKDKKILPGFYNGIGGQIEPNETPLEAIKREVKEETGTNQVNSLQLKGILTIKDKFGYWYIYIFIGTIQKERIEQITTPEGKLEWIKKSVLKTKKLVPDLFPWIDLLWQDIQFFFAKVEYDNSYNLIGKVKINTIK